MPKKLALAGVIAFACLVLGSVPASAHAALVGTDPGDGSSLETAPATVTLTFNEPVGNPAYVAVTAPDGSTVKTSKVSAVDKAVTAQLASTDMKGTYTLSYRVVSSDSHPVEGSTTFDVTTGRAVSQVAPAETKSFVHRHKSHIFWGLGAAVVAIGLLLWPLRSRNE